MVSGEPVQMLGGGPRRRASSSLDWKKWGEVDPLFGVASWAGRRRGDDLPWTDEEFYGLGREDWEDFRSVWGRYGMSPGACVEIGCGAGRITAHLAETFERVDAVDISQGMIDYARGRVTSPSVTLHLVSGVELPLGTGTADAVFSTHVFQHLDSHAQAATYFAEIARVMKDGATMMIHLPVHDWPLLPKVMDLVYGARRLAGDVRAFVTHGLVERNRLSPAIRGLSFPVGFVFGTLHGLGMESIEITIMTVRSNGSLHPFVLARKAAASSP
jgi:SAM-dependent methyltransferase